MLRRVDQVLGTLLFQLGCCLPSFHHCHVDRNFPVPIFVLKSKVSRKIPFEIGGPSGESSQAARDIADFFVRKGEATMGHDVGLHPCCEFVAQIAQSCAEKQSESLAGKFAWKAFMIAFPFSVDRATS
jgi:hypothetical protein